MKLFIVKNIVTGAMCTQGGHVTTFDNKAEAKACRDTQAMLWAEEVVGRQCANSPWRVNVGPDHRRYVG